MRNVYLSEFTSHFMLIAVQPYNVLWIIRITLNKCMNKKKGKFNPYPTNVENRVSS